MNGDVRREITRNLANYSRIQKKLASFLVDRWNEIPLMSIEHISRETDVSTATITRFFQQLGFDGFFDFKEGIKSEIKEQMNPVDKFRSLEIDLEGKQSLLKVANQDVENINKLLLSLKEKTFRRCVAAVDKAERVFSHGTGVSTLFAGLIAYIFNQIQKETHLLDERSATVEEKILTLTGRDLLIFCSFSPYSRSTVEYAELARERGLRVMAISDNAFSPISQYADPVLQIPRENLLFTSSISAFSVLINALAIEIALERKDELSESIKKADQILKRFYLAK